jgi:threonine 3-dehydrogenase
MHDGSRHFAHSSFNTQANNVKSLRKLQPGHGLSLQDVPLPPAPPPGEVLLKVKSAGICGTDLHIDEWTASYHFLAAALPVTVGHEFSGEVAALGEGVTDLVLGQLVAVRPSVVCGICTACMSGKPDACITRRGIGVLRDGGFAPFTLVPARNCVPIPAGVDAEVAAMTEPLTVSHEAVRCGDVKAGERVLVLGPGNIGQGIAVFARAAGAGQVVVAGHGDAARFEVLKKMGFTDLIDFAETGMEAGLASYLKQGKFDVVIEATGAAAVIKPALAALKTHGILVIAGIHAAPVAIDLTALVRQHQQLRGSYRAPEKTWPEVVAFMQAHQETLRHMITHRLPLSGAYDGFALARNKAATKVMVLPELEAGE